MKNLLLIVLLTFTVVYTVCDACPLPLYYEYINDFALTSNHLKNIITSNFSKFALNNITASNGAQIYDIQAANQYDPQQKSVSLEGLKIFVVEGYKINFRMKMNLTKLIVEREHFNITAVLTPLRVFYDKEIKQGQLYPKLSNLDFNFDMYSLKFSYQPKPSDKDEKKIIQALNATIGKTFRTQLESYLKKINFEELLSPQCLRQPISKVFTSGIYKYKNGNSVINFDMKFNQLKYFPDGKVLRNGLNGSDLGIVGHDQQECFSNETFYQVPNSHTFISREFINNMVKSAMKTYPQFNNVVIDKNSMKKTKILQFKLTDLKNIIPSALIKYKQYSDNQIGAICRVSQAGQFKTILSRNLKWYCEAYVVGENSFKIPLTVFQVTIKHTIDIGLSVRYLVVSVSSLQIQNDEITFYDVDQMQVTNVDQAKKLILDTFQDMKVYTVGTYFDVLTDSNEILYGDDGIWISKTPASSKNQNQNLIFEQ